MTYTEKISQMYACFVYVEYKDGYVDKWNEDHYHVTKNYPKKVIDENVAFLGISDYTGKLLYHYEDGKEKLNKLK